MTTATVLTGLDGTNPLAYLAALGTLAVADAAAPGATLSWRDEGRWRPVLTCSHDRPGLIAALVADVATWRDDPAIALSYTKAAKDGPKKKKAEPKIARDLKPTPEIFARYLEGLLPTDGCEALPFLHPRRRPLDYAGAFGTDVAFDNAGNVKPTALHFTAGQQEFLKAALGLVDGVTAADLDEALFGPWKYQRELPVLGWDATAARDYALRATDPAKSKKAGVPGADWLAFRGLAFYPVAPVRTEIRTVGCTGGWKSGGAFTWPLWSGALTCAAVRSVVSYAGLASSTAHERRARGIAMILRSGIRRSDQGGYGSFMPSDVVAPGRR